MGSPLPADCTKPNGSRYLSGTEWEFEDVQQAAPSEVYIDRRTSLPQPKTDDPSAYSEMAQQMKRRDEFLAQFRHDDDSFAGSVDAYETPDAFREKLTRHLEDRCGKLLALDSVQIQPPHWCRRQALNNSNVACVVVRRDMTEEPRMKIIKGQTALITGASKGIGVDIARALASKGMNLVLAARSASELESVRADMEALGVSAIAVPTDVSDQRALDHLVECAVSEFGTIDVLMNNAGIEHAMAYDQLSLEHIERMIQVNLQAPMALTRMILPDMLARNRGHIVNMSSAAGVLATAYTEPYNATKFGLVGFTRSLRLTLQERGSAVSASVICPGFLDDAGMYENMKQQHGVSASRFIGSMKAEKAAKAVVRAIERDLPDVLVMPGTPRIMMAMSALWPKLTERFTIKIGANRIFREAAEQRMQAQTDEG